MSLWSHRRFRKTGAHFFERRSGQSPNRFITSVYRVGAGPSAALGDWTLDWKYLFTSFNGRIGRQQFWFGAVILIVASLLVGWILLQMGLGATQVSAGTVNFDNGNSLQFSRARYTLSPLGGFLHSMITLWPAVAISLKRRHDRGSVGYDLLAFWALNLTGALLLLIGLELSHFVVGTISIVTAVLGVYLFVVMGFLKGDEGSNRYGPDPLEH